MTVTAHEHAVRASTAIGRASRVLLACQHSDGSWPDTAAAGITLAAEALLVRELLGTDAAGRRAAADQIRARQRADGSWPGAEPGPAADVSASVLAYLALRLAGDSPDAYHMAAAAGWIREAGGIAAIGPPARAWLAMFGQTSWAQVPAVSPESLCLPARRVAGRQADRASGSRVVVVTIAILAAIRPVHPVAVELSELQAAAGVAVADRWRPPPALSAVRSAALRRCGNWLAGWLQYDVASPASRPAWPCSIVAAHLTGHPQSGPALSAALARLVRPLPPVALTTLAVEALRDAGLPGDHPALLAAAHWLLQHHIDGPAASLAGRDQPAPSGWTFCPDGYPRAADTALALRALSQTELPGLTDSPAISAAVRWLALTQHPDGSWDGSVTATGYCVLALLSTPCPDDTATRAIRRGVVWLLRAQLSCGAWPGGRRGSDLLATTGALPALLAAGVRAGKPAVTGALGWLLTEQHADGGWHLGDVTGQGKQGHSDPAGTARALLALLAAGADPETAGLRAAADWLTRAQRPDGSWAGPGGALLPLAALGRYVTARQHCRAP